MSKVETRQERIHVLAEELRARGAEFDTGDLDDEAIESFLQHVLQFESAEHKPLRELLADSGFVPVINPADDDVATELHRFIEQLAFIGVLLENTDHLSDRELYTFLTDPEHLDTPTPVLPGTAMHIDVLGGCSDDDDMLFLKYYASDEDRERWKDEFPDEELPPREPRPYDRDSVLPKAPEAMNEVS
jgi:hypothetical protein